MIVEYNQKQNIKEYNVLSYEKIKNIKCSKITNHKKLFESGFVDKLIKTCIVNDGVGIASPQVGVFINLFVVKNMSLDNSYYIFINPEYKPIKESGKIKNFEGCLSIPGKSLEIERWASIEVLYDDYNVTTNEYKRNSLVLKDMESIIFLHEYDHLFGRDIIETHKKQKG